MPSLRKLANIYDALTGYRRKFPNVRISVPTLIRGDVTIGEHTYLSAFCDVRGIRSPVRIGKFCSIASRVMIISADEPHAYDTAASYPFYALFPEAPSAESAIKKLPVSIGHDVWIGAGSMILPGVQVGNGAVVGAGAVVTKNVRPYAIVGGVPAREIKMRFPDEIAARVEALGWWDWPLSKIRSALPLLRVAAPAGIDQLEQLALSNNHG